MQSENVEMSLPFNKEYHTPQKRLQFQNNELKRENKSLQKELVSFSTRLDQALRKHTFNQQQKNDSQRNQIVQMELKNAYKKCEIYRKEISFCKKQLNNVQAVDNNKIAEKCLELQRNNDQYHQQIKDLKRIIKIQEKGLTEIGMEGYLRLIAQNETYKENLKRLKKINYTQIGISDVSFHNKNSIKKQTQFTNKQDQNNIKVNDILKKEIKLKPYIRKERQSRMKTAGQEIKHQQYDKAISLMEENIVRTLKQRLQKEEKKNKTLNKDKLKLRQLLDNTQNNLQNKEKQILFLKNKIQQLRKNNLILQRKHYKKQEKETNQSKEIFDFNQARINRKWEIPIVQEQKKYFNQQQSLQDQQLNQANAYLKTQVMNDIQTNT